MSYVASQPAHRIDVGILSQPSTTARHPGNTWTQPTSPLSLPSFAELGLSHEPESGILWQFMTPNGRPSFTPGLLRDMTGALDYAERSFAAAEKAPFEFLVLASGMPGIFNLGGDLPHFIELIERGERDKLIWYARICAKGQYRRAVGLQLPICTVALVQGDALGGGFEAALAHDVIIAERSASFGLPEVLFNLFPGMGAYSFLARRLDPARTERMILSGRVYPAEELHAMGIVDVLADDGAGLDAVRDFTAEFRRASAARHALLRARKIVHPVTMRELIEIADLWADAALRLQPADLRRMRHLAKAQDRRWEKLQQIRQSA